MGAAQRGADATKSTKVEGQAETQDSERALTFDHCKGCAHENCEVERGRPRRGVPQVQTNHLVEADAAPAANLPQSGNSRLDFQDTATMPSLIGRQFIWNRRTGADERHFALQNVQELRQLIQACPTQELSDSRDPRIARKLVDAPTVPVRGLFTRLAGDEFGYILFVKVLIAIDPHGTELKKCELLTVLSDPLLSEKHRTFG